MNHRQTVLAFGDGRCGINAGPYEVPAAEGAMTSGHYLTFWRLEGDDWKVIFDTGAAERP